MWRCGSLHVSCQVSRRLVFHNVECLTALQWILTFCLPAINTQPNVLQCLTGQLLMVQVLCEGQLKSQVLTKWCTLAYCYYGNSFSNPPTPNCIKVYSPLQSQFWVSVSWFPSVAWVFPKLFHSVSQNVGPSGVGKCDVGFKWAERQAWLN